MEVLCKCLNFTAEYTESQMILKATSMGSCQIEGVVKTDSSKKPLL